jgi:nucleoside phosphorylase
MNPMVHSQIVDPIDADPRLRLELENVTIGIVTALPEEFVAVTHVLGCQHEVHTPAGQGGRRTYKLGVVRHRSNGAHIVAVTLLSGMGTQPAAIRSVQLKNDCPNLKDIIMCGIAGAVPNPSDASTHVRLGDIVVSGNKGVIQYDLMKQGESKNENRSPPRPPSSRMLAADHLLEADERVDQRTWEEYLDAAVAAHDERWRRPAPTTDVLRDPPPNPAYRLAVDFVRKLSACFNLRIDYRVIPHPRDDQRREGRPRVFRGVIACSNALQKHPMLRNRLRDEFGARAIEMEASGIADAAHEFQGGYFVVRSTCDYCNHQKNDVWHNYAALTAASYTRSLIEVTTPYYTEGHGGAAPRQVLGGAPIDLVINGSASAGNSVLYDQVANRLREEEQQTDSTNLSDVTSAKSPRTLNSEAVKEVAPLTDAIKQPQTLDIVSMVSPMVSDLAGITSIPVRLESAIAADHGDQREREQQFNVDRITHRDSDYAELLVAHAHRLSDDIEMDLKKWEFQQAFVRAAELGNWLAMHYNDIPNNVVRELYYQLARVATVQARQNTGAGGTLDFSQARLYLSKAKNVRE